MNKTIFVTAYTAYNLGDDLFLKILFERYPKVNFILDATINYDKFAINFQNVQVVNLKQNVLKKDLKSRIIYKAFSFNRYFYIKYTSNRIDKIYSETLKKCDGYISIGGSIFMQNKFNYKISYDVVFYNRIVHFFHNKQKWFIGCNFGPYTSELFKADFLSIFQKFTSISFRDVYSYNLFKSNNNVLLAPDVVFSLKNKRVNSYKDTANKNVGFSIRFMGGVDENKFIDKHIDIIQSLNKLGYNLFFFAFCEKEGDVKLMDILKERCHLNNIIIHPDNFVKYTGNIDLFLDTYKTMHYMISERFHSMILSFIFNQIVIPICYSNKMVNVLQDVSFTGHMYSLEDFVNTRTTDFCVNMETNDFTILQDIYNKSENHFANIDSFLYE